MPRLTQDDLARITSQPGYTVGHCSWRPTEIVAPRLPDALAQRDAGQALHGADQNEEAGGPRIVVRITRCGTQLLDADNLAGGCKPIIDALRYRGLIPEDDPQSISLIVQQRKVPKKDTGTLIEIYPVT